MTRTVQSYINKAFDKLQDDQTFSAKAHQKDAIDYLNRAFDLIRHETSYFRWDSTSFKWSDVPLSLHCVREKHSHMFDDRFDEVRKLSQLRQDFKATPVIKPEPKDNKVTKKHNEVTKTVEEMIKDNQARYNEALDMARLFGGLNVSVTPHLVTNEYNTTFTRCFYYLEGKLTRLSIIMAVAEQLYKDEMGL